jgi:hypothetical protein
MKNPNFTIYQTSQPGQVLLQWIDGPGAAGLKSLQMPADVAAFIVRACNSHDAFISLAELVRVAETDDGFAHACFHLPRLESILGQARRALNLAKDQ